MKKGLELKIEAVGGPAVPLNAEERTKRGIFGAFQPTLGKSGDAARNDTTHREVLGQDFVEKYLSVNEVSDRTAVVLACTN